MLKKSNFNTKVIQSPNYGIICYSTYTSIFSYKIMKPFFKLRNY